MASTTRRRLRWGLTVVTGCAALLLAAGCGGSSGGGSGGTASSEANGRDRFSAYLDCLRGQGIAVPNATRTGRPWPEGSGRPTARPSGMPSVRPSGMPGGRGGVDRFRPEGVDDTTWQKAQAACRSVLPTGRPSFGPGRRGESAAYRNCLSDHGVQLTEGMNTADPKTARAMKACAVLRPTASPS